MSGKEVKTWLEYSASKVQVQEDGSINIQGGLTYYDVIYGEGFSYVIDPSQPAGSRIVSMTYNGEAVADDAEFTVVINNYRFNGGGDYIKYLNEHGCEFLANDPDRISYSTQYDMIQGEDKGQARNLLADYIREAGEISPTIDSTWSIKLPRITPRLHQPARKQATTCLLAGNLIFGHNAGWYGRSLASHLK